MLNIPSIRAAAVTSMFTAVLGLTGCVDLGVDPPLSDHNVQLSVQAAGSVLFKTDHEVLHIVSVKVLLTRISFTQTGSGDSSEVATGPLVLDLNLEAKMTPVVAKRIRAGVYDRVHFELHKPGDVEVIPDSVFRLGIGGNDRFSVVITGYYHETPFTFVSRESAQEEFVLNPPVNVTADGNVNVTLKVDPYAWFTVGGLMLDPFNQEKQIDDRIKDSFASAFKDNDRNGEPDR